MPCCGSLAQSWTKRIQIEFKGILTPPPWVKVITASHGSSPVHCNPVRPWVQTNLRLVSIHSADGYMVKLHLTYIGCQVLIPDYALWSPLGPKCKVHLTSFAHRPLCLLKGMLRQGGREGIQLNLDKALLVSRTDSKESRLRQTLALEHHKRTRRRQIQIRVLIYTQWIHNPQSN